MVREFLAGENWAYRDVGVEILANIVRHTTGKTVAAILRDQVFDPMEFTETGWYGTRHPQLVNVIRDANDPHWWTSDNTDGGKMNMYVSARELAYWGYLHLRRGAIHGASIVPDDIIRLATSLQSPKLNDSDLPQNGYLWFVNDHPARRNEIGDAVPRGSYQMLGYTGVTLLVIPRLKTVAVRMFNSWGSPPGYDYLKDVRSFGDCVAECART